MTKMTFNKKITIEKKSKVGTGSFAKDDWIKVADVWAHWVNAHGTEALQAESLQTKRLATVTVRYRRDITEQCRIVYEGILYDILSINDVLERHISLEMKVRASVYG